MPLTNKEMDDKELDNKEFYVKSLRSTNNAFSSGGITFEM